MQGCKISRLLGFKVVRLRGCKVSRLEDSHDFKVNWLAYLQGVSEKTFEYETGILTIISHLQDIVQETFFMENKTLTMLVKSP